MDANVTRLAPGNAAERTEPFGKGTSTGVVSFKRSGAVTDSMVLGRSAARAGFR